MAFSLLVMAALQALPPAGREALRFDRIGIAAGQWWRLVSGHFVHLTWGHYVLNAAGLVLGTWLFGTELTVREWIAGTFVTSLACGLGLYLLSPDVYWCVGLSGVLHGLMLIGAIAWIARGERAGWWLGGLWVAKLVWENARGEMPWSGELAGGPVVTSAHVWGAAGGAGFMLLRAAWRALPRRL